MTGSNAVDQGPHLFQDRKRSLKRKLISELRVLRRQLTEGSPPPAQHAAREYNSPSPPPRNQRFKPKMMDDSFVVEYRSRVPRRVIEPRAASPEPMPKRRRGGLLLPIPHQSVGDSLI